VHWTDEEGKLGADMVLGKFNYERLEKPSVYEAGTFSVIFSDIVGFTTYGDNVALRRGVRALQNAIVDIFDTDDFHWDDDGFDNELLMLPTGDGYGIAFDGKVKDKDVLNFATQLSSVLSAEGYPVRIGVAKGPCFVYKDLNYHMNLVGWGIIDAERAMSCGGPNHILCTDMFAKPCLDTWSGLPLHDIGEYQVKGRHLHLYNCYSDTFGNPERPIPPVSAPKSAKAPAPAKTGDKR
jgi:class 3 adenylate cyclase